jgi:hypothetical protein
MVDPSVGRGVDQVERPRTDGRRHRRA